nr:ABC transporter C family member 3-like [Tanacetum cinerariifolium]
MGQRQLICLRRVLLKKTKVLVLDEATASVDTTTDGMIQQTLQKHITDSTMIMIAYRITFVLDSDMVLVLEQGLIDEYDSPTKFLEDKTSSFVKLVAEYSMRSIIGRRKGLVVDVDGFNLAMRDAKKRSRKTQNK